MSKKKKREKPPEGCELIKLKKAWNSKKKGDEVIVDAVRAAAMVERGECSIVEVD